MKKTTSTTKINKSEFVRSFPAHAPAKEIVEKGKEKGIKLSIAYVYSIRTAAKAAARRRGEVPTSLPGQPNGSPPARAEELLRAVAAELGLSRAIGILQSERQKVRSVLGGV